MEILITQFVSLNLIFNIKERRTFIFVSIKKYYIRNLIYCYMSVFTLCRISFKDINKSKIKIRNLNYLIWIIKSNFRFNNLINGQY